VQRVKALAEALAGSPVGELDLTEAGTRIVIRRRLEGSLLVPVRTASSGTRGAGGLAHAGESGSPTPDPTVAILAPLTGVYYSAAAPTSPPYVEVGDSVEFGQVVCLVEAMKVFNEVKSEVAGVITTIVAQPGQLIHKGDVLMRVQPA
jgi:acetyl-CoA carboxylase biotin carboxyl carrier protein